MTICLLSFLSDLQCFLRSLETQPSFCMSVLKSDMKFLEYGTHAGI